MIDHTDISFHNDRLREIKGILAKLAPHEHADGMNECAICDQELDEAILIELRKLQTTKELLEAAKCPECDGSGAVQVQTASREYVTREMAIDAGDPSMEGSLYSDDQFEVRECQWCAERKTILSKT